jgi:hypothetical protein
MTFPRTRLYRYVAHDDMPAYEALGWLWVADLGDYHGQWSCLMAWPCACACVEPRRQKWA